MTSEASAADKRIVLFVATLSSFLAPFMISAVNIAIPVIGGRFAASAVGLSWFATAYLLAATMFLVPFGRLADIHGRKKIFVYCMFIYVTSSLIAAVSNSAALFITARVVEGTGAAMIMGNRGGHPHLGIPATGTRPRPGNQRGRRLPGAVARALHRRVPH